MSRDEKLFKEACEKGDTTCIARRKRGRLSKMKEESGVQDEQGVFTRFKSCNFYRELRFFCQTETAEETLVFLTDNNSSKLAIIVQDSKNGEWLI